MDRSFMEYNPQTETYETEQSTWGETEWSGESESEGGFSGEWSGEVFNESEVMELAAELLEVRDEAELDRFLGDFLKKAVRTVGNIAKSPIGKAIGGVLKTVAKKALRWEPKVQLAEGLRHTVPHFAGTGQLQGQPQVR